MEMTPSKETPLSPKQTRVTMSTNVLLSMLLALSIVAMLNYLAIRHNQHVDVVKTNFYSLSQKSTRIVQALSTNVQITVFHQANQPGASDVRKLLSEYKNLADKTPAFQLTLEYVDSSRDIMRSRAIIKEHNLKEPGVVIVKTADRHILIPLEQLVTFDYTPVLVGQRKRKVSFSGEQFITSAIYTVTHHNTPVVYFLTGHGERDIESIDGWEGLSRLKALVQRDNIIARPLALDEHASVPKDCAALVVAGPRTRIPKQQLDKIEAYLVNSGRAFFLIDSGQRTGLVRLLARWSVRLNDDVVVGKGISESEVIVRTYTPHPITETLENVHSVFGSPRSLTPLDFAFGVNKASTHKPTVSVLASSGPEEWAETNLINEEPEFLATEDTPGPVPIAVAVEQGTTKSLDAQLRPTRLIVIGDSECIHNNALKHGIDAKELFMNSLNWLLERDELIDVTPKRYDEPKLQMTLAQYQKADRLITMVIPGIFVLLSLIVWHRRKN